MSLFVCSAVQRSLQVPLTTLQHIARPTIVFSELQYYDKSIYSTGLHKLWYPGIRYMSTWSKFGAHGEHGDVFLFSNLGVL